jgi:hypothetical protein
MLFSAGRIFPSKIAVEAGLRIPPALTADPIIGRCGKSQW